MFGLSDKQLEIPDFGGERLLVTNDIPVCEFAESRFGEAASAKKLIKEADLELICFLTVAQQVREIRFGVASAYLKNKDYGAKNGFVYDPGNWLHGFVFNRCKGLSFVGRPLRRVNSRSGMRMLEEAFPDIDPGFMTQEISKRLEYNPDKWLRAQQRSF